MDDKTTIQELKDEIEEFCEERDWTQFHNPKDLMEGAIIEVAELMEHFRWKSQEESYEIVKGPKREDIEDEFADILAFLMEFARVCDIDVSTVYSRKLEKTKKKYPVEKVKGNNKKYNEY